MAAHRRLGLGHCAPPISGAAAMTPAEVAINIGIGVISAALFVFLTLVWQKSRRHLKNGRAAEFLDVHSTERCSITLLTSPRGMMPQSSGAKGIRVMTHNDTRALFEIYRMVDRLGGSIDLNEPDSPPPADRVEFCLGGPRANSRTEHLLRQYIPNVSMRDALASSRVPDPRGHPQDIVLGDGSQNPARFTCERDHLEYAILARVVRSEPKKRIFIVAGQTSVTNLAAVSYLARHLDELHHRFGNRSFCLIVLLTDSGGEHYENVDEYLEVSLNKYMKVST